MQSFNGQRPKQRLSPGLSGRLSSGLSRRTGCLRAVPRHSSTFRRPSKPPASSSWARRRRGPGCASGRSNREDHGLQGSRLANSKNSRPRRLSVHRRESSGRGCPLKKGVDAREAEVARNLSVPGQMIRVFAAYLRKLPQASFGRTKPKCRLWKIGPQHVEWADNPLSPQTAPGPRISAGPGHRARCLCHGVARVGRVALALALVLLWPARRRLGRGGSGRGHAEVASNVSRKGHTA